MLASFKAFLLQTAWPAVYGRECSFVISFPKSGRTWHRLMLGIYLAKLTDAPEQCAFRLGSMCSRAGIEPIRYSHNNAGFKDGLPPASRFVATPSLWRGQTVLFLVRNPRDVLVSAYHHAAFRASHRFRGTISEFIRAPETGIAKVMKAYGSWHDNRHLALSHRVHSYEEMQADPAAVLRSSLDFFGILLVESLLPAAVDFCRFDRMQAYERLDRFGAKQLRNVSGEPRAAKVREGRVGSFRTALSAADRDFIDNYVAAVGDPFAPLYEPGAGSDRAGPADRQDWERKLAA